MRIQRALKRRSLGLHAHERRAMLTRIHHHIQIAYMAQYASPWI
jgi:hypothetical protein